MPELGESVTEGTVTRWLKKVGDTVEVDEPLVEVSTDKVDTEIPSPVAGTLVSITAEEDDTVAVGGELAKIGDADAAAESEPEPESPRRNRRRKPSPKRRPSRSPNPKRNRSPSPNRSRNPSREPKPEPKPEARSPSRNRSPRPRRRPVTARRMSRRWCESWPRRTTSTWPR